MRLDVGALTPAAEETRSTIVERRRFNYVRRVELPRDVRFS